MFMFSSSRSFFRLSDYFACVSPKEAVQYYVPNLFKSSYCTDLLEDASSGYGVCLHRSKDRHENPDYGGGYNRFEDLIFIEGFLGLPAEITYDEPKDGASDSEIESPFTRLAFTFRTKISPISLKSVCLSETIR